MSESNNRTSREEATLDGLEGKGPLAVLGAYMKLSGPGWLQSAITLGGGSLSSSLFLGVIAGFGMMWIQPVAMIMGVIMLSAIAYVTLATGERPFDAIRNHINPSTSLGLGNRNTTCQHGLGNATILHWPSVQSIKTSCPARLNQAWQSGQWASLSLSYVPASSGLTTKAAKVFSFLKTY